MDTYTQPVTAERRYQTLEEKQGIVEETLAEGTSVALVALVARTHGVNANLVSTGVGCIKRDDWVDARELTCCRSK